MAKVTKRAGANGRFTWYIQYVDPVTKKDVRRATKAKTKAEAEQLLDDAKQEIKNGPSEPAQEPEQNCKPEEKQAEIRFFEICDDFMAYSREHKRSWEKDQKMLVKLRKFFGNPLRNHLSLYGGTLHSFTQI